MSVTNNVKQKRTEKNIPQSELASNTGVHEKTISRIENGERNASIEVALRLAKYLKCQVEDLFQLK